MCGDQSHTIAAFMYDYTARRYDEIKIPNPVSVLVSRSTAYERAALEDTEKSRLKKLDELRSTLWDGKATCSVSELVRNAIVMLDREDAIHFISELIAYAESIAESRARVYDHFVGNECFLAYLDNSDVKSKEEKEEEAKVAASEAVDAEEISSGNKIQEPVSYEEPDLGSDEQISYEEEESVVAESPVVSSLPSEESWGSYVAESDGSVGIVNS